MKIRMIVEGTPLTPTLDDSAAAWDFASLLPLSLTLTDYAATEKVSDLPRRLSTEGAPACRNPCCCVSSARNRRVTSTSPGATRSSAAPSVPMAACRAKLDRTRRSKSGSLASKRTPLGLVLS